MQASSLFPFSVRLSLLLCCIFLKWGSEGSHEVSVLAIVMPSFLSSLRLQCASTQSCCHCRCFWGLLKILSFHNSHCHFFCIAMCLTYNEKKIYRCETKQFLKMHYNILSLRLILPRLSITYCTEIYTLHFISLQFIVLFFHPIYCRRFTLTALILFLAAASSYFQQNSY